MTTTARRRHPSGSKKRTSSSRNYDEAPKLFDYGGQEHGRFPGDHFLSNRDLIEEMDLFKVARRLPRDILAT